MKFKKDYEDMFWELVESLEKLGYKYSYHETAGQFRFSKFIEIDGIVEEIDGEFIDDEYNEKIGGTDWKKAYKKLKEFYDIVKNFKEI